MTATKRKAEEAFNSAKPPDRASVQGKGTQHKRPSAAPARDAALSKSQNPGVRLREKAEALLRTREQLPIWKHADEIRQKARENDVLLLVGETGSGKSTQIPQFLYQEPWCRPKAIKHQVANGDFKANSKDGKGASGTKANIGGRIAIIQPRRVAAISLATRVAAEIGTPLGTSSPASQVGYSVRFDSNVSPSTRIKFLTDGMLLQELLRDPWLREYSCVIVDEVHERGLNVDLVLGFLRRILDAQQDESIEWKQNRGSVMLKVVVMSATADMTAMEKFFGTNELSEARVGEAEAQEESEDWEGFSDEEKVAEQHQLVANGTPLRSIKVASCYIKGRQYPVTTIYAPSPITNLLDATMDKIIHIHQHTPLPGDILVFLSGQEMIENLESLCRTYANSLNETQNMAQNNSLPSKSRPPKLPDLQVLPLFASLPTHLQSRIFAPTPHFTRRIILSTNIAETSVTVPGIRNIIDTGKHKSRLFRPGLNLDTLLSSPITQSMAKQRAGRAGREAPGTCYRLYTEKDYHTLERDTKPEILSTDLNFLVLTLKAHNVDDILSFPLLTQPPRRSLEAALESLLILGALDTNTGVITENGKKMAMLPVRPDLARCLLEASKYPQDIRDSVADIIAALSLEEGIFLPINPHSSKTPSNTKNQDTKDLLLPKTSTTDTNTTTNAPSEPENDSDSDTPTNPIQTARRTLLSRHSDHLTLLNAINGYSSPSTHDRRAWCNDHGISHRAMSRVMDVRKQLRGMIGSARFRLPSTQDSDGNGGDGGDGSGGVLGGLVRNETILKCLVAGLWPNVAVQSHLAPAQPGSGASGEKGEKINPNQRPPYTTLLTGQGIFVHPSSVVFTQRDGGGGRSGSGGVGKKSGKEKGLGGGMATMPKAIVFTDLIYTSKPFARNVSGVELGWVAEFGEIG